jgi:hypothetical protein
MVYAPHIARLATPIGTVERRGDDVWIDSIARSANGFAARGGSSIYPCDSNTKY